MPSRASEVWSKVHLVGFQYFKHKQHKLDDQTTLTFKVAKLYFIYIKWHLEGLQKWFLARTDTYYYTTTILLLSKDVALRWWQGAALVLNFTSFTTLKARHV